VGERQGRAEAERGVVGVMWAGTVGLRRAGPRGGGQIASCRKKEFCV
jgi:hypothetical protein